MLTVIIITTDLVAPVAAVRLATSHNNSLEWAAWVMVILATASHVGTWRIIATQQTTFMVSFSGLLLATYEVIIILTLTFLLEDKSKVSKTN